MMSRMKSPRAAVVKTVSGLVIAAGLILTFACEQKSRNPGTDKNAGMETTRSTETDSLLISGSGEELKKASALLSTGKYEISLSDLEKGVLVVKEKEMNQTEEIPGSTGAGRDRDQDHELKGTDEVFFVVEEMPEFPGGEAALRQHIATHVDYPVNAREKGIQGKVYVTFVVSKNGSVRDVSIARGVNPDLDQEALRVINGLPEWIPGKQKGESVNVSYTVPISFVLQ